MHSVRLAAGRSSVALALPMEPRLETLETGSVVVMRGPLLYAAPRTIAAHDHAAPYDDAAGLLPTGQPHGRDNYLLGSGPWRHALQVDRPLESVALEAKPSPPLGQGVFTPSLVPAPVVRVSAVELSASQWATRDHSDPEVIEGDSSYPCANTTSAPAYEHTVAGAPPQSPVSGTAGSTQLELVPYGATDLRVAVFPAAKP